VEIPVKEWTPEQRSHYLETMELPTSDKAPQSTEEVVAVAPSDESEAAQDTATEDTGAVEDHAPENPPQTRSQRRNDNRYRRLADDNNQLRTELEQIKQQLASKPKTEAQSDAADDDPFPDANTLPLDEWQKQVAQWNKREVARGVAAELAKQRAESDQKATETEEQKTVDKQAKKFAKGYAEFKKTLPEPEQAEMDEALEDIRNYLNENNLPHLSTAIVESDAAYPMIRHLAKNWNLLESLAKKPANQALREFGRLEISEAVTGKAPKTITKAKPPNGSNVNGTGNGGSADDRYEEAIRNKDYATFTKINQERAKNPGPFSW
jgi:hypothetical protein